MIGRANLGRSVIALWCLTAAGCAELAHEPTDGAIPAARPAAEAAAPAAADGDAKPEPPAPSIEAAGDTENRAAVPPAAIGSDVAPPSDAAAAVETPPEQPPASLEAPSTRATEPASAPAAPAPAASPTPGDTLDFASLVARLRKTKAIGLLTKVAVKNESNDLLERFRAYHTQHGTATLADLRRAYDSLIAKLDSLLRDTDPPLARDIDRSRAAIWDILADPRKFTASHLMAGA